MMPNLINSVVLQTQQKKHTQPNGPFKENLRNETFTPVGLMIQLKRFAEKTHFIKL